MKRLRVVSVVSKYLPGHGGGEVVLHELLRALMRHGHECKVILTPMRGDDDAYILDGIKIAGIEQDLGASVAGADIIISQGGTAYAAGEVARAIDMPFVHIIHDTDIRNAFVLRDIRPDLVIFNSYWMAGHYSHYGPRGLVVYPPLRAMNVPGRTCASAITLINLMTSKGVYLFYDLADRNPHRHFLGVQGGYGDQMVYTDIPNVQIHPFTNNIAEVWRRTRLLLVPSWFESYGLAAMEAMSVGIPVIAHPTRGLREALGQAGLFAEHDDIKSWQSLLDMLDDRDTYARLSCQSVEHAKQRASAGERQIREWIRRVESLGSGGV